VSLTPADLRDRIEARIDSALGAGSPPWVVAGLAFDMFPGSDLSDREALSYAVGVPSTTFVDGRQPSGGRAPARTTVGVRFSTFLRSDAHVADYSVALTREALLLAALRGTSGAGGPAVRLVSVDRQIVGDGTLFVATILCEVFHAYPV